MEDRGNSSGISVTWRIFGAMTAVTLLVVLIPGWLLSERHINSTERRLRDDALLASRLLANSASLLTEADEELVSVALQRAADSPRFRFVNLYGLDGRAVSLAGDQEAPGVGVAEWSEAAHARLIDTVLRVTLPVISSAGRRRMLVVGYDGASALAEARGPLRALPWVALALLFPFVLVSILLGGRLGKRLDSLRRMSEDVSRGDLSSPYAGDETGDEIGEASRALDVMLANLKILETFLIRVAEGDLSITLEMEGQLAAAANQLVANQRALVSELQGTSVSIGSASEQFMANAKRQDRGTSEQSSAVEETRRAMESLLRASEEIGKHAAQVLEYAERTQSNSQLVSSRIGEFSRQTVQISEIMGIIKDIAVKSDVLALNAALEGSRAGEAGKGFSHIASQMKGLAESVVDSVRNIEELWQAVNEATSSSVLATEETTKLAASTTDSVRKIALIIRQQQSGTEQVTRAMAQVTGIASHSLASSREIVDSTKQLVELSQRLELLVDRFRLGEGWRPDA